MRTYFKIEILSQKQNEGFGEMGRWLRVVAALAEGPDLVPSTQMAAHSLL